MCSTPATGTSTPWCSSTPPSPARRSGPKNWRGGAGPRPRPARGGAPGGPAGGGDHTPGASPAVLRGGARLAGAQAAFAAAGQRRPPPPPLSPWGGAGDDAALEAVDAGATIGG